MEVVVDAARCVGEDGCVAAQELGHTDGQDHLLHGVALVVVEATLGGGGCRGEEVERVSDKEGGMEAGECVSRMLGCWFSKVWM